MAEDEEDSTTSRKTETMFQKLKYSTLNTQIKKRKIEVYPKLFFESYEIRNSDTSVILHMAEIQKFLVFTVTKGAMGSIRSWCRLINPTSISHVGFLVVDGVSVNDFKDHKVAFPNLQNLFDLSVKVLTPDCYGMDVADEVFKIPMTKDRINSHVKKFGIPTKVEGPRENNGPVQNEDGFRARNIRHKKKIGISEIEDVFPRTWLLLNVHEMLREGYILPGTGHKDANYVYTTTGNYLPVTDRSPMFALDCEMVFTQETTNELARVSLVSEDGVCIFDTLVKPYAVITDYRTKYSGIRKQMLKYVTTRLGDVQRTIQKLLPPDAILVGQSICKDLEALKMYHPYIIDTSTIYNRTGQRTRKTGLARLTRIFFGTEIQAQSSGHNPIEDASSALNLVLLKLSKGFEFGDVILESQNLSHSKASHSATAEDFSAIRPVSFQTQTETWRDEAKMKVFHSCGQKLYDDFFATIKTCGKTGVIIDKKSNATHESDNVHYEYCDNYDEIVKKAASTITKFDFSFIRLEGYRKLTEIEMGRDLGERLDCLKQLDSRIKQLHDLFPNNSVVVVLLTGRKTPTTSSSIENALCFVKVTHSPELLRF
ncbi:RNA exonuclease 5-like [Tubulanus polymorphus]|uniref:RNA exonuclease 5-like n=1 Tax=Tubulanus polymorphus TaxID=672921 RepID=UPI003DA4D5C8